MLKFLLALHLVLAVFVIGPLAWAAKTAGRGVRKGDAAATAASARLLRIYSYVSVSVVAAGFALMSQKEDGVKLAEFSDTWIWLSLLLWAVAIGLVLAVVVPTLDKAIELIAAQGSVGTRTARVTAAGGVVGLIFLVIVILMVYKPGS